LQTLYDLNGTYEPVFKLLDNLESTIELRDHLGGFDVDLTNPVLEAINNQAIKENRTFDVIVHSPLHLEVKERYSKLQFQYQLPRYMFCAFEKYNMHPEINYKNFVCSFNGMPHVSRKLLVSILHKFKWFNPDYCSKNFSMTQDEIDGHLAEYTGNAQSFYNKFFLTDNTDTFFADINSFGFVRMKHAQNVKHLESRLSESFIHVVSETMSTSYHPFVTEKFLYSVVTRGLFLAYGQPGWHSHVEKYYGFKKYTNLFDYHFDTIQNPIERLVELVTMISKFSILTAKDWKNLYLLEQETIEYNYNHYFSGNWLKCLEQHA
jgi:hypothetical protein